MHQLWAGAATRCRVAGNSFKPQRPHPQHLLLKIILLVAPFVSACIATCTLTTLKLLSTTDRPLRALIHHPRHPLPGRVPGPAPFEPRVDLTTRLVSIRNLQPSRLRCPHILDPI